MIGDGKVVKWDIRTLFYNLIKLVEIFIKKIL